jgi:cardiolipin synthase
MPIRRTWINVRRFLRRILRQDDPPERIARGVSAGLFAGAIPLPGVQIPVSFFLAWLVRGNAAVAVIAQAVSNPFTAVPMAIAEYQLGIWLWPGETIDSDMALATLRSAGEAWIWSEPFTSLGRFASAVGDLGIEGLGPFALGILALGLFMSAVGYPLTVIFVWAWRARRRRIRLTKGLKPPTPGPFLLAPAPFAGLASQEIISRYARAGTGFIQAETALLLVNGREAYPEMLAAIDGALETVDLETYILRSDRTGGRFGEALSRAARRGIRVRLLYDDVGSLGLNKSYVEQLLGAGVEVRVFHPVRLSRPSWALNRRDHRKILVVDRRISFTGGLNVADEYASVEEGGGGWRDTHLRLSGVQFALELGDVFQQGWQKAKTHVFAGTFQKACPLLAPDESGSGSGHEPRPVRGGQATHAPDVRDPARGPGIAVQVVSNQEFRQRRRIRRAYLHAIKNAQRYILIENAYFIPDRGIRRALLGAVRRGVKVAVAVARQNDVAVAAMASRALYGELLAGGVRLFEWPETMLHAKTAVIDDAWSVVGSYNLDHRSLVHNLEVVVVLADADFASKLREQTLADLRHCHELTLDEHEARPWWQALVESAAYQMRYWL